VEETALRQFEDELVKILRGHAKRVHQGGLDGGGYFCHPILVVTPFKDVNFGKWHGRVLFGSAFSMQRLDGQIRIWA